MEDVVGTNAEQIFDIDDDDDLPQPQDTRFLPRNERRDTDGSGLLMDTAAVQDLRLVSWPPGVGELPVEAYAYDESSGAGE